MLTIDGPTIGNREGERWFRALGAGDTAPPTLGNFAAYPGRKNIGDPSLTWDIVDWLRANTDMKIVLKGIVTREDAELCLRHGVDGMIVSNHGGRQEESNRATLDCLPEVVAAVDGQLPVLIDGGFRRGTDIYKALALGAKAVCIGRPQVWGLGAFGEEGVRAGVVPAEIRIGPDHEIRRYDPHRRNRARVSATPPGVTEALTSVLPDIGVQYGVDRFFVRKRFRIIEVEVQAAAFASHQRAADRQFRKQYEIA